VAETIADEFLVQNARKGDRDSFGRLYERYRDEIFTFVYRLSGSTGLAEAVTHDCFLRLLKESEHKLTGEPGWIRLYLYSTAHDLAKQYALDSDQQSIGISLGSDGNRTSYGKDHEAAVLKIRKAISSLPLFERGILLLTEYHGMELNEVAAVVKADKHKVVEGLATARDQLKLLLVNHRSENQ
jgi:RNA polymerase sigma-70 factor (ECF subfamily)